MREGLGGNSAEPGISFELPHRIHVWYINLQIDDQDDQLNVASGTIYMDPMGTWMVELSCSWFSCRCNCTIQYYNSMHPMGTEGLAL